MILNIDFNTSEKCIVEVKDNSTYPASSTALTNFKYSDSIGIIALKSFSSDGTETLQSVTIVNHDLDPKWEFIPTLFDGYFKLYYLIVPTKAYADTQSKTNSTYYCDGEKFYKNQDIEVDINELLEINPTGTTISINVNEFISICRLKKCFINICRLIFESRSFDKCKRNNDLDLIIYNRDLLWMTINNISYLTEFNLLFEAQRLIELIHGCNGICQSQYRTSYLNGCGCA